MEKDTAYLFEDGPEDLKNYPLIVRLSARRAIIKAKIQAKIVNKVLGSKYAFVCRFPSNAVLPNLLIEDFRSFNRK